jgi:hypothetical protein
MPEYWVEENVRPTSHQDSDRLLIDDIEPIVRTLKHSGIVSWHFLREGDGWRENQHVSHIRLRFEAEDLRHLKRIRRFLKRKLDILQQNRAIIDHYVGIHGKPVKFYKDYYKGGSSEAFDEQRPNPTGWCLVKKFLEVGSELALLLINGRMNRVQLGREYEFNKISHLFPNQCRHYPMPIQVQMQSGQLANLIAYDPANPTP